MQKTLFLLLSLWLAKCVHAQPENNNWFFGSGNGLNFSGGEPVNTPGKIGVMEGASAISDKNGQLLFYSDGIRVWNKNHVVMPNGSGLAGGYGSSTQSSVIIPKTKDGLQYYLFTTDQEGGVWGLQYSVVDMSLQGGLGDITSVKNVRLVTPSCEKVTAVMHCDRKSYWVITHKYGSGDFYAYRADENGVNPVPVISHTGSFIPIAYATMSGTLRASPDGKKIAAAHGVVGIELADFNNQTGILSNSISIFDKDIPGICYGLEFSSNSSLLYASVTHYWDWTDFNNFSGIFQFNVSLGTRPAIIASTTQLFRYVSGNEMGFLQRAPNGKIYMPHYTKYKLSVINSPNTVGTGCNFVDDGFLLTNVAKFSLPNLLSTYFTDKESFSISAAGSCSNKPVSFEYTATGDVTSLAWDFDDPASGANNVSALPNPVHIFSSSRTYQVKLIKYSPCGNDTMIKPVTIGDVEVNLGPDKSFCEQSKLILDPQSSGNNTYLWQDGTSSTTYTATTAGLHWVQVSSNTNGCIKRDSIVLDMKPLPVVELGKDTALCTSETLTLDAKNTGSQIRWQDQSTSQTYLVNREGIYWVEADLAGCKVRDSITVTAITPPKFSLGPDNFLCPGLTLSLSPVINGNNSLRWQDGTTTRDYIIRQPGLYYLDATNRCGITSDSIIISTGNCTVYIPSAFTPDNNGKNDLFKVLGTGLVNEFNLKIFDRNGQVVFFSKDKNRGWDGKLNNQDLPSGVYVYMIRYTEINNPIPQMLKGTITIIR